MKKLYFPLFALLSVYACTGEKPANDSNAADTTQVVVTEPQSGEPELMLSDHEIALIDKEVRSFFASKEITNDYIHQHCTPELQKYLSDAYDYERVPGEEVYATWLFDGSEPGGADCMKELSDVTIHGDGTVVARVNCRPNEGDDITDVKYVVYRVASVKDGVVVFSQCQTPDCTELPGKLGESAKVWADNLGQLSTIAQRSMPDDRFNHFAKYKLIDVDGDDCFELLADTQEGDGGLTGFFTLCDEKGQFKGIENARMVIADANEHNRVKFDLDKDQAYTKGFVGMGNISEECAVIAVSHCSKTYNYVKEVNPDNTDEFAEEASVSNEDSGTEISIEEFKKYCTHGKNVFSPTHDGSVTVWTLK